MNSSSDGQILGSRWRPAENRTVGLFERLHEELPLAGEDVGDAILAEAHEMRVRDPLRQNYDDRVAVDIGSSAGNLAPSNSAVP